jgi:hypothetical protein
MFSHVGDACLSICMSLCQSVCLAVCLPWTWNICEEDDALGNGVLELDGEFFEVLDGSFGNGRARMPGRLSLSDYNFGHETTKNSYKTGSTQTVPSIIPFDQNLLPADSVCTSLMVETDV